MDPANLANFANMSKQPGFSPDLLQQFMNPRDPAAAIKKFMPLGDKTLLEPLIEKVDLLKFGPDIAQSAVANGKHEIVELLVSKGVDLMSPPERVPDEPSYRRASYVLQAAAAGDVATLDLVLGHGGSIADAGFICLSKKRKNHVASNVIGAAAYAGKRKLLEYVLKRVAKDYLEVPAQETHDKDSGKAPSSFVKEFAGFTPLMLAVAKGDENFDCLQALLAQGADFNCTDEYENNLLHVAALYGNNKILDYLAKNLKLDLFARNSRGETALNICHTTKNQAGVALLEKLQQTCDASKSTADSLLSELDREEEQAEKSKAQRKQKKWRTKINRLAKAEGITAEEVERRLEQEEETKKQAAIQAHKAQEEKEKAELAAQQRQREELRRLREEQQRLEDAEEEKWRLALLEEERVAKQERERAQAEKRARLRSEQRHRNEGEAAKQPRRAEKSSRRQEDHEGAQDAGPAEARPSLRKERAKTPAREVDAAEQQPRQGRHQNAQAERVARVASKSQRREEATENTIAQAAESSAKVIYGLGGEMAIAAAGGKRAQARARKQMAKGAEEQKAHEEKLRLAAIEKEEAKKKAADEQKRAAAAERKEKKAQQDREKAEKAQAATEARELAKATRASLQAKAQEDKARAQDDREVLDEVRQSEKAQAKAEGKGAKHRERENKKGAKKDTSERAPEMVYRPKAPAAKAEEPAAKAEPVEEQKAAQTPQGDQPQPPAKAKKEAKPRRERKEPAKTEEAKTEAAKPKKEHPVAAAAETVPSKPAAESHKSAPAKEHKEKDSKHAPKAEHKEPKEQKDHHTSKEVASLQSQLLAKEHDVGRLQKQLARQEKKTDEVNQENHQLKEQLKLSSDENQLKHSIAQLNEQLTKQQLLNRLQAQQILEFEQSLWQEAKQREEAEERLHEFQSGESAPNAGAESTDQELRVKSVQIRQLQQNIDQLHGKATAINRLGRPQLVDLQEDLEQSLRKVQIAMQNTTHRK